MDNLIIIITAVLIDILFGELPSSIHPVVMMGKTITLLKNFLKKYNNKITGILITIAVLIIFVSIFSLIIEIAKINYFVYLLLSAFLLSTTFAIKSLLNSVMQVKIDLDTDLNRAKNSISYLVSRNTSNLTETEVISAAIETLTENITDSVIAPLIYTFIFGILGGVSYRVINTLDAMVGYKNPENINIGWFPARLDDLLNYIPARITGFLIVIAALILRMDWKRSYKIMMRDARKPPSPNSGYSMAAAAGALNIQLKKQDCYVLGDDIKPLTTETISETILLTKITILLFLMLSTTLSLIFFYTITNFI